MAFLKKLGRSPHSKKYSDLLIEGQQALIGRDNDCDIRIGNIEMSRRHARLVRSNDKWQITDLKSTNGVYINNERIIAMVPHVVNDGEMVSFGPPEKTEFVYKFHVKQDDKNGQKSETQVIKHLDRQIGEQSRNHELLNKSEMQRIKRLERQIEEQSKSQELLQKRLKQQEHEAKKKQVEIDRLTEQLKKEESEKQRLKESGEKQKKALKELKKRSKCDKQSVKCENRDIKPNIEPLNDGASTSGLQAKRKYEEIFDSELTCPICSELFIQPVHISCSHTFCTYCIELWKKNPNSHRECPICRKPMKHMIREIVIENLIDKIVMEMDSEDKQQRIAVVNERKKKLEELLQQSATRGGDVSNDSDSDMESSTNFSVGPPSFQSNFFAAFYNSSLMDDSQESNSDFGEMEFSHDEDEEYDYEFNDGEDESGDLEDDYWEEEDMSPSEVDGYETANSYLLDNGSVFSDDTEFDTSEDCSHTSDASDSSDEL